MNTELTLAQPRKQPLVRPIIWAVTTFILALGLGGATALNAFGPETDAALAEYEASVHSVLAKHNALAARWNGFVPTFNAVPNSDVDGLDVVFARGSDVTRDLVRDSQAVLAAWRRLTPPEQAAESHRLGQAALEATQDGYIAMNDYFSYWVTDGIADETAAQTGRDKLDEAAALWQKAQSLDTAK